MLIVLSNVVIGRDSPERNDKEIAIIVALGGTRTEPLTTTRVTKSPQNMHRFGLALTQ